MAVFSCHPRGGDRVMLMFLLGTLLIACFVLYYLVSRAFYYSGTPREWATAALVGVAVTALALTALWWVICATTAASDTSIWRATSTPPGIGDSDG